MQPITVLLVDLPAMLAQLIAEILAKTPDIRVSGSLRDRAAAPRVIDAVRPDVVIVGDGDGDLPAPLPAVLPRYPRMRVLTVGDDGKVSFLFELRRIRLGELSPETVVSAIRNRPWP